MKGEGKMRFKSKMKWVGLVGLVLSTFSLFTHFLLSRYTDDAISEYHSSVTIFSWRPVFETPDLSITSPLYRRLWGPVKRLELLHPHANPRGNYPEPQRQENGFIFVRIQGGFHEIRNSICDVVVIARLLNATLVIPEIQSSTSSKGISSEFKSFAYLYNEEQFMVALAKDVKVVKTLPKNLKGARRKKEIPMFKPAYSASPSFYLRYVLPVLNKHSVVELVVSNGGCLQAILPDDLEEYQRLRCRVAFHALQFRQEVQELATKILNRLRAPGRPFIAFDPGMTRDALAYYGCAELFQDVHTELIQHKRLWMIKRGIVKGNLVVKSADQRLNGSCPLMPEEVGILLRAYGYSWDTIIYISGGQVFGGQRTLIPLHAMFENIVDRTSLSTVWELNKIYGRETNLVINQNYPKKTSRAPPLIKAKIEDWKTLGPRPRPLPPPPARPKYPYNIEGWWGWVAESDNEPDSTIMELRTNAHTLLWEALDFVICVEADVFIPGFDRDGKGHPNFASLVMGQRLYQSASSRTFRPDRREVAKLLDVNGEHLYEANRTWLAAVRRLMRRSLVDGLLTEEAYGKSKSLSFLSHPVPECCCIRKNRYSSNTNETSSSSLTAMQGLAVRGAVCPTWMMVTGGSDADVSRSREEKENEDDFDESVSSGFFFRPGSNEVSEIVNNNINKEETPQMDDQEEPEGGER